MGSDQSTADEWVEIVGVGDGTSVFPLSLSGWTLTSLGTDGTEKTIVRFLDISIDADQYVIASNYPAAQSRLATEPMFTTTAMTLPNTKLLLRLRDGSGNIVDEVDDGIGAPFAGANPSGTGAKASMERVNLSGAGNVKEHWQTALVTLGFDPGVPIFGTPGFPRIQNSSSSTPSFSSSSLSSIASSSVSSLPSSSSSSVAPAPHSSSQASDVGSSCIPDVSNVHIVVQSGELRSEEKVTVNLQLLWDGNGTLRCTWDYRDGFTSASCNPPSHTFTVPGIYDVRVEAEDACLGRTIQTVPIEVLAVSSAGGSGGGAVWHTGSSSSGSCTPRTWAGIEIVRFLPNPEGEDSRGEWVELQNVTDRVAVLCGWLLDDAEGGSTSFSLDAVTLAPKEIRRLSASLTGLGLNNDQDHVRLFAPVPGEGPTLVQDVSYANAREGIIMHALQSTQGVQGRVVRVIDGDTVVLAIDNREVTVRLLGIDAPEPGGKGEEGLFGQRATEFLRGLLEGGVVVLDFDEERQDVYGRILAYLSVGGHDVQAELLKRGLAVVYQRCTCVRKEEYRRLEEQAREEGVGMWGRGAGTPALEPSSVRGAGEDKETRIPSPGGGGLGRGGQRKEKGNEMVFISEVYPVPLPAEGEWVELWNGAEKPVDLSGWKLDDAEGGGSRAWEFPEGFLIQPGAFILLRSDQTHLALNNEGDSVALIAPDGAVVDRITYGKLRRGGALARVIQRIGDTGEFRTTDRFCVTSHPTPFERNICRVMVSVDEPSRRQGGVSPFDYAHLDAEHSMPRQGDTSNRSIPSKVRRVVRLARRVRYRNILPPDVASGSVVAADPLFAALLERMGRSVQSGQVVWGEEEVTPGKEKMTEWEFLVLPLLAIVGCHGVLRSIMERKRQSLSPIPTQS